MKQIISRCVVDWAAMLRFWTFVLCVLASHVYMLPMQAVEEHSEHSDHGETTPVLSGSQKEYVLSFENAAVLNKPLNWPELDAAGPESVFKKPEENKETDEFSVIQAMTQMVLGLLVVVAMIVIAAWVYRRWGRGLVRNVSGCRYMELIETMPLGVKRSVSLMRVGDQVILLGQGEHDVNFLCAIDPQNVENLKLAAGSGDSESEIGMQSLEDENDSSQKNEKSSAKEQSPAGSLGVFKSKLEQMLRSKS